MYNLRRDQSDSRGDVLSPRTTNSDSAEPLMQSELVTLLCPRLAMYGCLDFEPPSVIRLVKHQSVHVQAQGGAVVAESDSEGRHRLQESCTCPPSLSAVCNPA